MSEPASERAFASIERVRSRLELRSADARSVAVPAASRRLVAEGDSWFDYPGTDILEELEDAFGHRVESVTHRGDAVESMAYGPRQLDKLTRRLLRMADRGETPDAVLLAAGGDDLAADELLSLLDQQGSGLAPPSEDIVRGLVDVRLAAAIAFLASTVTELCHQVFGLSRPVPILVHGYDYPVSDGRGGRGALSGPWLKPASGGRGDRNLHENPALMRRLIDRFNTILAGLSLQPGLEHVVHVDLRGILNAQLENDRYRVDWDNELNPGPDAFARVAARFNDKLREALGG